MTTSLSSVPGKEGVVPLLDAIIRHIPPPTVDLDAPFAMCVNTIATDNHMGRIITGKVESGTLEQCDECFCGEAHVFAYHIGAT